MVPCHKILSSFTLVTTERVAPFIIENLTNIEVNISGKILLNCIVSGTPWPNIHWLKDGAPVLPASGKSEDLAGLFPIKRA